MTDIPVAVENIRASQVAFGNATDVADPAGAALADPRPVAGLHLPGQPIGGIHIPDASPEE